jgi:hypothetical protein
MQKTELLVTFFLLQSKENVNRTIRKIAAETGVSVGSVHSVLSKLTEQGYIVESGDRRLLRKRANLIERWAHGYADGLKNKLLINRFTFLTPQVREQWQDIMLPSNCHWGGEPAATLLNAYLQPGEWEVYVPDNANALITTGRMIPAPKGEIFVYKRFLSGDEMPLLVVYADLLATEDDRCREAADRLKSQI